MGGYRSLAEDALGRIFSPEETTEIMQNIQEAVLMIAREIDEVHARPFGELGFDIAVDVHKNLDDRGQSQAQLEPASRR